MFKFTALVAAAAALALSAPSLPTSTAGSWQVDTPHSDAQLKTDATTDYGKTKIDVTLGFARVRGRMTLDDADPTKSRVDMTIYPATAMTPDINEDGKFLRSWLSNLSNHTLVCFHSKKLVRTSDGRLQATGDLVLTRVDRELEATPSEGYSGPVYGPPMIHRVSREATFVFDLPAVGKGQKDGGLLATGSTSMFREDYPPLVTAVLATYWPPVVQDKSCQEPPTVNESYAGAECTGKLLMAPGLPAEPHAANGEDVGVATNFNALVGNHLAILVHLHMVAQGSPGAAAGGN